MRIFSVMVLSLMAFVFNAQLALSQEAPKNWTIKPCKAFGPVGATTSHADFIRIFGKENVLETIINEAEGETYQATKLFPKDAEKTLEVLWQDEAKKTPSGFIVSGQKSLWKTEQGIGLGTTLKELEKLNGGSFEISGFDWDLGGAVLSWSSGALGKALPKIFRLQLGYTSPVAVSEKEFQTVMGDKLLKSNNPVLQKLNPHVDMMSCNY